MSETEPRAALRAALDKLLDDLCATQAGYEMAGREESIELDGEMRDVRGQIHALLAAPAVVRDSVQCPTCNPVDGEGNQPGWLFCAIERDRVKCSDCSGRGFIKDRRLPAVVREPVALPEHPPLDLALEFMSDRERLEYERPGSSDTSGIVRFIYFWKKVRALYASP